MPWEFYLKAYRNEDGSYDAVGGFVALLKSLQFLPAAALIELAIGALFWGVIQKSKKGLSWMSAATLGVVQKVLRVVGAVALVAVAILSFQVLAGMGKVNTYASLRSISEVVAGFDADFDEHGEERKPIGLDDIKSEPVSGSFGLLRVFRPNGLEEMLSPDLLAISMDWLKYTGVLAAIAIALCVPILLEALKALAEARKHREIVKAGERLEELEREKARLPEETRALKANAGDIIRAAQVQMIRAYTEGLDVLLEYDAQNRLFLVDQAAARAHPTAKTCEGIVLVNQDEVRAGLARCLQALDGLKLYEDKPAAALMLPAPEKEGQS